MDKNTMQEIAAIWDKLLEMDKKISDFIDSTHAVSTSGIAENSDGILDIAELSDENSSAVEELGSQIQSLDDRVTALENK